MEFVVLIGRILFGALFLMSAMGHLTRTEMMAGYAGSKGVPSPALAVRASGLLILAGGLMVILGLWADLGALFLVAFLVATATMIHGPWKVEDAQEKQMAQVQFLKDLGLAGAALMLFALFARLPDLGLMITEPVFADLW